MAIARATGFLNIVVDNVVGNAVGIENINGLKRVSFGVIAFRIILLKIYSIP
jgi:hypothetical protein